MGNEHSRLNRIISKLQAIIVMQNILVQHFQELIKLTCWSFKVIVNNLYRSVDHSEILGYCNNILLFLSFWNVLNFAVD